MEGSATQLRIQNLKAVDRNSGFGLLLGLTFFFSSGPESRIWEAELQSVYSKKDDAQKLGSLGFHTSEEVILVSQK